MRPTQGRQCCGGVSPQADLLHEISTAEHDEEEGDTAEDDMGDAMIDDDDDDANVEQLALQPWMREAAALSTWAVLRLHP